MSFPAVPRHGSWQVVLAEMTARRLSSAGRAEPPELEEVLRVSIEADDEVIELHPRGQ